MTQRMEHDLIGNRKIPNNVYYGVQSLKAKENFGITGVTLSQFPTFITSLSKVKKSVALANYELGLLEEFKDIIKMGRTQLQDAVPMTLGQEFHTYVTTIDEDIKILMDAQQLVREMNLGATAIGTGINSHPEYACIVEQKLQEVTDRPFVTAKDLIEATQNTGAYVQISGVLKRVVTKISKICNDLRLLSSGPKTGLNEINLPAVQTGSSIMPGKVNPVIPEVAKEQGIRPSRPLGVAVVGSQIAITASPISATLVFLSGILEPLGVGYIEILAVCIPTTFAAVMITAFISNFLGKDLVKLRGETRVKIKKGAKLSVAIFITTIFAVVTYATLISKKVAVEMDDTGSTRIGKYVFNHPFMIPGVIAITLSGIFGFMLSGIKRFI